MRITTTMKRRTSGLIMLGIGLTLAVPATAQMPQTAAAAAAFLVAAAVAAGDYDEVPRDRSAKDILPAGVLKGAFYRVRDVVPTDGYTDQWKVDSDFGLFEVDGDGALRKLIGEIHAISELKKVSKTEAFAKGLRAATRAPIGFAKSLFTHPVATVSGVPKGAYQIVENAATSATTTRDPSEDAKVAQVLKMSSFKRDLAAKLDVDVYTSNKVLQKELNSVAWAATLGDLAVSVTMMPAGVGGSVVSGVRTVSSVKNALKEEPPGRLRIINDEKLTKIGMPEGLRKRFLDHPVFTSRHDTIIASNLEALTDARGRDKFLTVALGAQDEAEANLYAGMVQLLRGYHETVSHVTTITPLNRITVAQTKGGPALIALPIDRMIWTQRVERAISQLKTHSAPGFNGKLELWLTGTVSPRARQELAARGFSIVERAHTRVAMLE